MSRFRVLIADDHVLIQEGLRRMLEPGHEVVDAVSDGRSLVDAAFSLKPDLIILDVSMPLLGGIEAARQIRKRLPRVKLLFLTVHANPAYLREALSAGAMGYILKSSTRQEILDAIKAVLEGQRYISRGIVAEDFDLSKWEPGKAARSRAPLTSRERQVLQLLAEGRTAKEVADALRLSPRTVAFHRNNMKRKLGLRKSIELIKRAVDEGFI
jgi:DNA-binding NarL/FixJ family response regulator